MRSQPVHTSSQKNSARTDIQSRANHHAQAAIIRRNNRAAALASLRLAIASAEYLPCFQFALRLRSRPSGVRGPVLGPPCIRHRPFAIAAPLHEPPRRVRAPHRGVVFANSRRLNRMRVRAWSAILATPSGLPGGPTAPAIDLPCNNSLAALRNMDVLHCHHLTTAGSHALQREQARLVGCR